MNAEYSSQFKIVCFKNDFSLQLNINLPICYSNLTCNTVLILVVGETEDVRLKNKIKVEHGLHYLGLSFLSIFIIEVTVLVFFFCIQLISYVNYSITWHLIVYLNIDPCARNHHDHHE